MGNFVVVADGEAFGPFPTRESATEQSTEQGYALGEFMVIPLSGSGHSASTPPTPPPTPPPAPRPDYTTLLQRAVTDLSDKGSALAIGEFLRRSGIKSKGGPMSCPLATYLTSKVGTTVYVIAEVAWVTGGKKIDLPQNLRDVVAMIDLVHALREE